MQQHLLNVAYCHFEVNNLDDNHFSLKSLLTKSRLDLCTIPSLLSARFLRLDFLVSKCRRNDFWCVIFPVPVTLKRFLALEFVLTFGIFILLFYTLLADLTGGHLSGLVGNQVMVNLKWDAKVGIFCNQLAMRGLTLTECVNTGSRAAC